MIKEMSGVGGGGVAGIGVDAPGKPGSGEPGVSPKHQAKNKSPILYPEMMRRTVPNMVKEEEKKVKIKLNPEKKVGYTVHSVGPGRKLTLTKSGTMKAGDIKEEEKKVKIKLNPEKKVGYTVHSVGPGRKLTLTKSGTMKAGDIKEEEKKKLLSKDVLRDYINKASDNRAKNQGEFDFYYKKKNSKKYGKAFRNVINRRKGIRAATDRLVKEETFAGATVFEVSSHTFHNAKMEKRKGKHWRTYLDECDELSEIRQYANKNPGKAIVLQNRNTNEMVYVRYGNVRYGKAR